MSRKKKDRTVNQPPLYGEFKPTGVSAKYLNQINLNLDEYEALRLSDYQGMSQEEASNEMNISRPTFTRLIENARKKLVEFILTGKKLKIEGGNVHFKNNVYKCFDCEQMFVSDMKTKLFVCPICSSSAIKNLAGSYGHGKCCTDHEF